MAPIPQKQYSVAVDVHDYGVTIGVEEAGQIRCDYPSALALADRLAESRQGILAKHLEVLTKVRDSLQARLDEVTAKLAALGHPARRAEYVPDPRD